MNVIVIKKHVTKYEKVMSLYVLALYLVSEVIKFIYHRKINKFYYE